jgi:hypothetical protein
VGSLKEQKMTSTGISPQPQVLKIQDLCCLGSLIETKISHEINLIGYRMAALVISESFLFGAFAVILASPGSSTDPTTTIMTLLLGLPVLGFFLVLFAWPSLFAARRVMQALCRARGDVDKMLQKLTSKDVPHLPNLGIETREPSLKSTLWLGDLPLNAVPALLAVTWLLAFLARFTLVAKIGLDLRK